MVPSRLIARFTTAQTNSVAPMASESSATESFARGTMARASQTVLEVAAAETAATASAQPMIDRTIVRRCPRARSRLTRSARAGGTSSNSTSGSA